MSAFTSVCIPHGGGPLPLIQPLTPGSVQKFLTSLPDQIPRPERILVISAHFEAPVPVLLVNSDSRLLFDYFGFPPETYDYQYPAPQDELLPEFLCSKTGMAIKSDRGWDHGVFVPLMLMYPLFDIPLTQVSLISSLDVADHLLLGESLSELPQGTLLLGSGFTFHNLQAFMGGSRDVEARSLEFDRWLNQVITEPEFSASDRKHLLLNWKTEAPFAEYCHPRSEHLMPLFVCVAANKYRPGRQNYSETVMGAKVSGFIWT